MGKVYGYCRTALADEEEMKEQIRLVANYCENNNLMVDGYFCDNGVSGFNIGEEFKQLLGEVKDGDTIVVKDIARLSRSNAKLLMMLEQFEDMGVRIVCVYGNEADTLSITKWLEERWAR